MDIHLTSKYASAYQHLILRLREHNHDFQNRYFWQILIGIYAMKILEQYLALRKRLTLSIVEAYLEHSRTSTMKLYCENSRKPLTLFVKKLHSSCVTGF